MRMNRNLSGSNQYRQGGVLSQPALSSAQRGFTLIEVIIVMAIMAIVAGIGIPSFSDWREKQAVRSASQTLMAQLKQARILALAENRDVTIKICDGTVASAWVFDATSPTANCDPCVDVFIPGSSPPQKCMKNKYEFSQFSKNLVVSPMTLRTFTSRGTFKQGNSSTTLTVGQYSKKITVNVIGRAYLQ